MPDFIVVFIAWSSSGSWISCSLIGITYSGLCCADAVQLALRFPEQGRERDGLDQMVDGIRDRWGAGAVARASLLGHTGGMPVLARPTAVDADRPDS